MCLLRNFASKSLKKKTHTHKYKTHTHTHTHTNIASLYLKLSDVESNENKSCLLIVLLNKPNSVSDVFIKWFVSCDETGDSDSYLNYKDQINGLRFHKVGSVVVISNDKAKQFDSITMRGKILICFVVFFVFFLCFVLFFFCL